MSNQLPPANSCCCKGKRNLKSASIKTVLCRRSKKAAPGSCTRGMWVYSGSRATFAGMQGTVLPWACGGTVFCLAVVSDYTPALVQICSAQTKLQGSCKLGDDVIAGSMPKCQPWRPSLQRAAQPCMLTWVKWYCLGGSWVNGAASCENKNDESHLNTALAGWVLWLGSKNNQKRSTKFSRKLGVRRDYYWRRCSILLWKQA